MVADQNSRILITGATGFTGRLLRRRLEGRGLSVFCLHQFSKSGRIDLRDSAAVRDAVFQCSPTHVVHLGGITSNTHPNVPEIYDVNVVGTAHLYTALAELPIVPLQIIHASSVTVYAPPVAPGLLTEDSLLRPIDHYGSSKLAGEEIARHFGRRLPILIVRPFNCTGPGQDSKLVIAKIVHHFRVKAPEIRMGDINIARDFSNIGDAVEIYDRLLNSGTSGTVVNISSGRATTLSSVVNHLKALSGHDITIIQDPQFMRAGEPRAIFGSTARLESLIGPMQRVPLEQTLKDMLES
ncbi:WcaG Nucleoside-diphosphate-sugar epimerases [Rhabdaerophilaceae bacterium]